MCMGIFYLSFVQYPTSATKMLPNERKLHDGTLTYGVGSNSSPVRLLLIELCLCTSHQDHLIPISTACVED